jgi:Rod binding domain-containing protein
VKIPGAAAVDTWANGRRIPDATRAAEEFESFLVAEVWKQSQRGQRWSTLLGDGSATRMVNEMWIDELVGRAAGQRGLGLAESLGESQASASKDAE